MSEEQTQKQVPESNRVIYKYNQTDLIDDDSGDYLPTKPGMIEYLRNHYAQSFPELIQATYYVSPPDNEGDAWIVEFNKKVGKLG